MLIHMIDLHGVMSFVFVHQHNRNLLIKSKHWIKQNEKQCLNYVSALRVTVECLVNSGKFCKHLIISRGGRLSLMIVLYKFSIKIQRIFKTNKMFTFRNRSSTTGLCQAISLSNRATETDIHELLCCFWQWSTTTKHNSDMSP